MTGLFESHLPVLPVLLPLLTAVLLLVLGDGFDARDERQAWRRVLRARVVSLTSIGLSLGLAVTLAVDAHAGDWRVYRLGEWPAPFGIALVVDRLSALMVLLTQAVALPVAAYACAGWDTRGRHFHALLQFQLMGLAGAFVTGDLFNLFVFFEVLLIASYVLLVHGQGLERLRVGVPYVALNLAASGLFLIGVALLYAVTGTLNLADLALRVGAVTGTEALLLQVGGLLLLVVFGFKAALLPLHLWLPATYAAASPPVAALFALMTKVGVYAMLRVHGVVFGDTAGESALLAAPWLLPLALGGSLLAALGAMAAGTLSRLVGWLNIASVGTILLAVALFSTTGWSAAIYYTLHSTLVVALLFLLADLIARERGDRGDRLASAAPMAQRALLGTLMVLAAASIIGLPPLPGFLGKLMILQAVEGPAAPWVWAGVLLVGFLSLLGLSRAGSILFWHTLPELPSARRASPRLIAATLLLVGAMIGLSVAAEPLKRYTDAAALQLEDREGLARAVLGPERGADAVRPYRLKVAP
ncbi:monovalent cation/H+ antiporter subunit D [Ramlibacter rhizophilus]|uniref:Monovalent cation/H+ antiporter subunit D n=1 Tax=Ramlibacter rhizophilus TaxID=1781167 RepID=A0A4Z0BC91_9BURK|nr:monovalent cation/H+ antiporter subunit D [Ramlibacter rhizophilus]TFY96842.1 monovalent cation/H+ antiporter subunit D [Ramlibacter rhizophilus]